MQPAALPAAAPRAPLGTASRIFHGAQDLRGTLAAATHSELCGGQGCQQLVVRKLQRGLGRRVFNMLRQDVSSVSALLLACEGGHAPASLFRAEVRKTIVQWHERLSDAISAPERAALLLGQFLAGVPEREAREEFVAALAEWAGAALGAARPAPGG
ncbi:unnamed protein product, partial [Prorocentrum cordatum]